MTRPIATRCGEPAHVDAPEPKKALIPMADWLARHGIEQPEGEPGLLKGFLIVAIFALIGAAVWGMLP